MPLLPLSFPVFYHCAVKGNTILSQYDAVSVLLTGLRRDEEPEDLPEDTPKIRISDADAANYISGKKNIKREILERVPALTLQDAVSRLSVLGFQDVGTIRNALVRLLNILELSPDIQEKLLSDDSEEELTLAASMFLMALRCPSKKLHPLTQLDKKRIASCYTGETIEQSDGSAMDLSESRALTAEEIEQILQMVPKEETSVQKPAKRVPRRKIPPTPEEYIPCTLFMGDQTASALTELTNITLSSGVTAFSVIFEKDLQVGQARFGYYDNFSVLHRLLFGSEDARIIYKFSGESPQGSPVHGYFVISTNYTFLKEYYEEHRKKYPLRFVSYTEALEYEASIYLELGSIFSGASTTVLADYLDSRIVIEATEIRHFKESFNGRTPIFAGELPFSMDDTHFCAYLLLDYLSAQTMLTAQDEFYQPTEEG